MSETWPAPPKDVEAADGRRRRVGLPWPVIVGLGALGAPRVVLHDLGWLGEGFGLASLVLTVAPLAVWIVVLVRRRVEPLLPTALAIGGVAGVVLAAVHQVLWDEAFGDEPPSLGGNLEDALGDTAEELVLRLASVPSSLGVGLALGLGAGLVARFVLARRPG